MALGDRLKRVASRAAVRSERRVREAPATTGRDLAEWARARLHGLRLVLVSNREPYSELPDGGEVRWVRNAGGLTVALDGVARALGAAWVAQRSATSEVASSEPERIGCPPDRPAYSLRRLTLSREDHERYYAGFSNGGLWPLCHIVYVRPRFELADWERYRDVYRRFADAVVEEAGDGPCLVFLQDYHLALAARFIKERRPDARVALFWHIPWPNAEVIRRLPWRAELLDGMLANDLIGFHIRFHALNFLHTVADTHEARVDHEKLAVDRGGRRTFVRDVPISVDLEEISALAEMPAARNAARTLRERFAPEGGAIGLGVDRMDYTKGIPERLEALERLFETRPEWIGRFRFVQVGVPSRIELEEYRAIAARTRALVERLNGRFGGRDEAVTLIEANLDFRELLAWYLAADVCVVSSLHDGMNLVAKEYVAARVDGDGALVLSPFTGAARELERAWMASPYDKEALADSLHAALAEPAEGRRARMRALREAVARRTIFDWAKSMLEAAVTLPGEPRAEERDAAI